MNTIVNKTRIAMLVAAACAPLAAHATNGMNLQGYGPIAGAMGGASMAYDNGTAAVMNNPATLSLGSGDRLDVAIGALVPSVKSSATGAPTADSTGGPYIMPALGYVTKKGDITYGVGVFAQGGMGTDYDASSFLALGSGSPVRSELGVGRLIFPLSVNVSPNLTVGGSIDYVWATLDLRMALSPTQMNSMVTGCSGAGCAALGGLGGASWVRIDFSDESNFNGAAKGTGLAGKLGFTYKIDPSLTIGGSYHMKTRLSDLETNSVGATMSAGMPSPATLSVGKILVRDFQWPETYALGLAWNSGGNLMIAADVKRIGWKNVMESFKMTYDTSQLAGAGAATVNMAMPQNWEDQTVIQIGGAYKTSDVMTVRAGFNAAKNPIPDTYLNPLFPAIFKTHYDIGLGYDMSKSTSLNFSYVYTPSVSATGASGVTTEVGGYEVQAMYTSKF